MKCNEFNTCESEINFFDYSAIKNDHLVVDEMKNQDTETNRKPTIRGRNKMTVKFITRSANSDLTDGLEN